MTSFIEIPDSNIFNLREASNYLRLTEVEIQKLANKLQGKVIDGKLFFLQKDLDNFKENGGL